MPGCSLLKHKEEARKARRERARRRTPLPKKRQSRSRKKVLKLVILGSFSTLLLVFYLEMNFARLPTLHRCARHAVRYVEQRAFQPAQKDHEDTILEADEDLLLLEEGAWSVTFTFALVVSK